MSEDHERRLTKLEDSHDRTLSAIGDLTGQIRDLVYEIKASTSEHKHLSEAVARIETNQRELGVRTGAIEKFNEGIKPFIEIVKSLNGRLWVGFVGIIATSVMMVYKLAFVAG